jgi:hypothetical protein
VAPITEEMLTMAEEQTELQKRVQEILAQKEQEKAEADARQQATMDAARAKGLELKAAREAKEAEAAALRQAQLEARQEEARQQRENLLKMRARVAYLEGGGKAAEFETAWSEGGLRERTLEGKAAEEARRRRGPRVTL